MKHKCPKRGGSPLLKKCHFQADLDCVIEIVLRLSDCHDYEEGGHHRFVNAVVKKLKAWTK